MRLTEEQSEYLERLDTYKFKAIHIGTMPDDMKAELKLLDEFGHRARGEHIIANYQVLT